MSDSVIERANAATASGRATRRRGGTPRMHASALVVSLVAACLSFAAAPALARNDIIQVTLAYVQETADDSNVLEKVTWHFVGNEHAALEKKLDPVTAKASTSAAFKRDEDACARAFLSALIELQTEAFARGANSVIEIRSIAGGQVSGAPDRFLCRVGDVIAHVSLTGVPAVLAIEQEEEEDEGEGTERDAQREARWIAPLLQTARAE